MAITARYIMNNDISRCLAGGAAGNDLPDLIWYPEAACETTYAALARHCPRMRTAACRAAIYCNYQNLFDELMTHATGDDAVKPTRGLLVEAEQSGNPHYREVVRRKAEEAGIAIDWATMTNAERRWSWQFTSMKSVRTSNWLNVSGVSRGCIGYGQESVAYYNGSSADPGDLILQLTIPESWRATVDEGPGVYMDYKRWPPSMEL